MGYMVEIWGWKEREELEKLEEKYLRWTLGVEGRTPWYLVREELQRNKLRVRAARRAWEFQDRLREGKGSDIARRCWEEMKERTGRGKALSGWEREREEFFERRRLSLVDVEMKRVEGEGWYDMMKREEREKQRGKRWEKIRESKYNRWYKEVKREDIPGYLKKRWGESRWMKVARFRMGNEVKERRYWEEKKLRRLCGGEVKT